jgi:multimeric flavodoxin WrbA
LADEFARGAQEAGNEVEKINLVDKDIHFCKGCFACQKIGRCVIPDDANAINAKIKAADVLVFATPIYYYEMSGQMKTMLDRANPLYDTDYAFRDVYLIATASDEGDHTWSRAASGLEGWIECFDRSHLAGVVFGGNATDKGDVKDSSAMQKAYETGKSIH